MTHWTSAYIHSNNIRIHYTRTGGNKPPVILLHGLMTSGLCWTLLARALENEYDVIMPDSRGHGLSDVPETGYQYADLANDVVGLIRSLKLKAPVLIGHSMGGMTAAVVASLNPTLLSRVILADPSFISPALQLEVYQSDVASQHKKILSWSLKEVMADASKRHPTRPAALIEIFSHARLQTSMQAFEVLRPPNPDFRELIQSITVPGLLLYGDRGVVSADIAKELEGLNPGLLTAAVPNAGHSLHMDQPEHFARLVKDFLSC
ncbi:alpha/beta fold hydrolase [Chitinophaga jiangningensis]|nr:alpha/beta hydrolase [Chitinophaga jiangningensis]